MAALVSESAVNDATPSSRFLAAFGLEIKTERVTFLQKDCKPGTNSGWCWIIFHEQKAHYFPFAPYFIRRAAGAVAILYSRGDAMLVRKPAKAATAAAVNAALHELEGFAERYTVVAEQHDEQPGLAENTRRNEWMCSCTDYITPAESARCLYNTRCVCTHSRKKKPGTAACCMLYTVYMAVSDAWLGSQQYTINTSCYGNVH